MNKLLILSVFSVLTFGTLDAQVHICGDHLYKDHLEKKYPDIEQLYAYSKIEKSSIRTNKVYRIPVVVHIVYHADNENLTDELIMDQIAYLNEDFRRLTPDTTLTRDVFKEVAGDTKIEFYLAEYDPEGNPTNGITRTYTDTTTFMDIAATDFFDNLDNIKSSENGGIDPWDQSRYLNIWVGNMDISFLGQTGPFLLGFAYPPVDAPNWPLEELPMNFQENDGVVIAYQAFGRDNPNSGVLEGLNDRGRTLTHEVGHYLGLRHVWGDGACAMDDGIEDTPPMSQSSQVTFPTECSALYSNNSCFDSGEELPDMIENYMDYSPEKCQNVFTQGQIDIMRASMEGSREDLSEGDLVSVVNNELIGISLYPNPTTDMVRLKGELGSLYEFMLFDMNGVQLEKRTIQSGESVELKTGEGIYTCIICDEGKDCAVEKLVVLR